MIQNLFSLLLLGATFLGCCEAVPADTEIQIVPRPISVTPSEGVFKLSSSTKICLLSQEESLCYVGDAVNEILEPIFGEKLKIKLESATKNGAINILCDPQLEAEAYSLTITPDFITIVAGSPAGAFYGVQTLRQMLPSASLSMEGVCAVELPSAVIEDKPTLAYRGTMLDVCRHFFTVDEVKSVIDLAAMHKLNRFHWHLTDDQGWRIEIKKYPKLTEIGSVRKRTILGRDPWGNYDENTPFDTIPHGGFFTQEQIRDVVDYASRRFVTIIPEIEFPGHACAALASYPWLSCTGEQYEVRQTWDIDDRVFCIGKETTHEFIENVLAEVIELFPSEYIHIGGDECPTVMWEKCPNCKALMKAEKFKRPRQLQNYATARCERFLNSHGRKLIGWDEILEGEVTPTATIMSWRGVEGGIQAAKMGNQAIMSPTTFCYFDYYQHENKDAEPLAMGGFVPVEKVYSLNPYEGLNTEQQKYILGVQCNVWTEYIGTISYAQYMLVPRISALAEVGWSLDRKDYADYLKRVQNLEPIYKAGGFNYAGHIFQK